MKIGYVDLGGITTAPDGTITYDFHGHIHAQGLDLDATTETVSTLRQIQWLRPSDGALVADAMAYEIPGLASALMLEARDVPGIPDNQVFVSSGAQSVNLLSNDGSSSFLRTAVSQNLGMDAGVAGPISVAAGWNVLILDLTTAWRHNHFAFVASINPTGPDSTAGVEAGPLGLAQGFVRVNTSVDQDILIHFITAGN